ncbi:mitochondrial inner membrane protease subunit 1 [Eurytemora carolleeae]|uniref:mitochondrial inner membrane protease subunit 1 n=1 Tax=Eurytemora carolleeae TaxID=1294199 RepID=UPI000C765371|nr:mitochondrial inner membrane protease subunit 1 [Eurytemora carolleeae]|eukprot:XP_023331974.1 mitochondrial inner membrane protease subunit 1-like [Eurytemora affinis]
MENVRRLFVVGKKLFIAGCVIKTFTLYGFDVWLLTEKSMEPTLTDGEIVLCCPSGRLNLYNLSRGDIVIARNPTEPRENICKRIVGIAGDRVPSNHTGLEAFVPAGRIWLQGDNLSDSRDSRSFGSIPIGLVRGKLICRVWPIDFNQPKLSHSISSSS